MYEGQFANDIENVCLRINDSLYKTSFQNGIVNFAHSSKVFEVVIAGHEIDRYSLVRASSANSFTVIHGGSWCIFTNSTWPLVMFFRLVN